MSNEPIEDHLDELLRRSRADARTTRRLLEEASDHLYATAAELRDAGMAAHEAEAEAVRRFGPVSPVAQATFQLSVRALVLETVRAGLYLAGWGLVAIGGSGLVVLVMNAWAGRSFVGGQTVLPGHGASIQEVADDAVVLRVIAGLLGVVLLLGYLFLTRRARWPQLLPAGLVDVFGAVAFAVGTAGLAVASIDQAAQTGTAGVGFTLSGALVALPATGYFCVRALRTLLAQPRQAALPESW